MKLYVFDILHNADLRTVCLARDAQISFGEADVRGRIFLATRASRIAAVVETEETLIGCINLQTAARNGQLAAIAEVEERHGLMVIAGVRLTTAGDRAWVSGQHRDGLSKLARWWHPAITVAALSKHVLPLPHGSRAPGNDVLVMEIVGDITRQRCAALIGEIEAARSKTIAMTIDSRGGDLSAALDLYRALSRHDALVEAHILRAESAAAVVALAADHRTIAENGVMMLHRPHVSATGMGADDLRLAARQLDGLAHEIAAIVSSSTRIDIGIARSLLYDETSFDAGQAIATGLAHAVATANAHSVSKPNRARPAHISGPSSVTAKESLLELGRLYAAGERIEFGGRVYRAKHTESGVFGGLGTLRPDRNSEWQRVP